jgi:PPM family protein phosphatase
VNTRFRSAKLSLAGRRSTNEDAVIDVHFPDGRHLIAVADGMGGHQSGEVASAMAIEVLNREVRTGSSLRESLIAANSAIYDAARSDPRLNGMGTTMVALLRTGSSYVVANVGDSRAYRVARNGIFAISRDHSFEAEAMQSNLLSREEIARSPWRNALTRSLGSEESVEVDVFGPFSWADSPHIVLLCSDGVYRGVADDMVRKILLSFDDLAVAAEAISTSAFNGGSDDNMSLAMVEFGAVIANASRPPISRAAERTRRPLGWSSVAASPPPVWQATPAAPAIAHGRAARASRHSSPDSLSVSDAFRRLLRMVANDNALFGLSVALLLFWLLTHLSSRG